MSISLTPCHMTPMEMYYVQVLDCRNIEGRKRNRCWLLVSDGYSVSICLLKPYLNYLNENMLLSRFTVIKARFIEVKPMPIKKVLSNLYQLPSFLVEKPIFFIQDIKIVTKINHRIILTLKESSTFKIALLLNNPKEVNQLEIPTTLIHNINKCINFIHDCSLN